MCGIAGRVDFGQPPGARIDATRRWLARCMEAMRHRGPDGEGHHIEGPVALAHTRLAIVDPEGGHQPMISADGRHVLIYNGEIHVGGRLRPELERLGHRFRSGCDTETLLAGCIAWGPDVLPRLDGMFAFFYWDTHRQWGFAARDRLGVKPLFVHHAQGCLTFASEIGALLACGVPRRLNPEAVMRWAAMPPFSGAVDTPIEGVRPLPPGGLMEIDASGPRFRRWWRWRLEPECAPDAAHIARVAEALPDAVAAVSQAELPVSAFFSGGLDSTAVVAAAQAAGRAPQRLFTIDLAARTRFESGASGITASDDLPEAEAAARALDLPWQTVQGHAAELRSDLAAISAQDGLLPAWEQQITQHRLARATRAAGFKITLVGDAADETHHGYPFLLDPAVSGDPARLLARFGGGERAQRLLRIDDARALEGRILSEWAEVLAEAGMGYGDPRQSLMATAWLIVDRWLVRLLHNGDVHTMAHGLEARVPFAQPALLEVARRVPPWRAFAEGEEKRVLRRAAPGVPDRVRWRRKSALPADPAAGDPWREGVRALWAELGPEPDTSDPVSRWLNLPALMALAEQPRPLTELERGTLFQGLAFAHWARHLEIQ